MVLSSYKQVLLEAVEKLRKRRLLASACMSVFPFVLTEQFGYQMMNYHEILCLNIFRKPLHRKLNI